MALEPGDALLLYTDGVTGARHAHGMYPLEERVAALAAVLAARTRIC